MPPCGLSGENIPTLENPVYFGLGEFQIIRKVISINATVNEVKGKIRTRFCPTRKSFVAYHMKKYSTNIQK